MAETKLVKAPRFVLDKDRRVIDLNSRVPVEGIVVFDPRPVEFPGSPAEESPLSAMKRWSEFRQSWAKRAND